MPWNRITICSFITSERIMNETENSLANLDRRELSLLRCACQKKKYAFSVRLTGVTDKEKEMSEKGPLPRRKWNTDRHGLQLPSPHTPKCPASPPTTSYPNILSQPQTYSYYSIPPVDCRSVPMATSVANKLFSVQKGNCEKRSLHMRTKEIRTYPSPHGHAGDGDDATDAKRRRASRTFARRPMPLLTTNGKAVEKHKQMPTIA